MTPAVVARRFVAHLQCLHRNCSVFCSFMWRGVGMGAVVGSGAAEEQFCRWSEQWGSWQLPCFKEVPTVAASCSIQAVERAAVWRITTANSLLIKQSDTVMNVIWLNYFSRAALEKHSLQQVYWQSVFMMATSLCSYTNKQGSNVRKPVPLCSVT